MDRMAFDQIGTGERMQGSVLLGRRGLLAGLGASGALLILPGCESIRHYSLVEAIRRLLLRASRNAFARLTAPDGFYDDTLARLELPRVFGSRGDILNDILISALFKRRLQHAFNRFAERGAERAAPIVADAVEMIGVQNAVALVRGGPDAATHYLRGTMGMALVDAMVPALSDAMRVADDPLVGQALSRLAGVDINGVARDFAVQVDDAIWGEIGREEAAIRADPGATGDPAIASVFGRG